MTILRDPVMWASKAAFAEHLKKVDRAVLVGNEAEAPRQFYSFSLAVAGDAVAIGIVSSGLGSRPKIAIFDNDGRVLVGHDMSLTWVNTETLATLSTRDLNGVFFDFLSIDATEEIAVVHELGALRVDRGGSEKWSIDTDVIDDFRIGDDGRLVLKVMGEPSLLEVSLASGLTSRGSA